MPAPHAPPKLPVKLDHNEFSRELGKASHALGRLDGSQNQLLNPALLLAPLTAKEAEVSSRIEGTQTNASELFLFEASGESSHSDTRQVANYRAAMLSAAKEVRAGRRISAHFIKSLHSILLDGVPHRGRVGEFRKDQVWIAEKSGDPIEKALYVPPIALRVDEYIENLLGYLSAGAEDPLIQAGIAHYQFEAIHPFDDGNGRIGRLLVPLLLCEKECLSSPIIYMSGYFESHRDEYRRRLHDVDETGRYEPWLRFFFSAVVEQAAETQRLINEINALHAKLKDSFGSIRSPYALRFLEFMFRRPMFTLPEAQKHLKASRLTCIRLLDELQKQKAVEKLAQRRGHALLYSFDPLIDLVA